MEAFREGDLQALGSFYTPDGTFMAPGMDVIAGRDGKYRMSITYKSHSSEFSMAIPVLVGLHALYHSHH